MFLALFRDASFVVTNSFHGTAFSVLYKKQFFVLLSKKRNSRIVTLCEWCSLENRIISSWSNGCANKTNDIDYSIVDSKIHNIISFSKDYLLSSISKVSKKEK